ncbi:MAG TPA: hypothetical protein VNH16_13490 [Burkholderiales bacterium]|jgi:hypothetical protein|nr:hypothetical protein [Burkholderiales bacterium]
MFRKAWCAAALAAAMLPAHAQDQTREEVKILQQRVDELERRMQEASAPKQSENAFNPAVSAILNGVYSNLSQDPNTYRINGFVPTMGDVAPPRRGFSLGESELGIAANVDHLFRGTLIAAIQPDGSGVEVEEAYIQTLALSRGFSVKAGRFFSAVGYQNQIHAHAWDFTDQPLVMKAFLGGQLNDDGVQVKWVAPTELYVDVGAEFTRGHAFPASDPDRNGAGAVNWFAHLGGDIGASLAWQTGLSYLTTSPRERVYDDPQSGTSNSFSGASKLWALSGVLKWAPEGNSTVNNFKLQGEYFRRSESGELTFDPAGAALTDGYASRQSGWYAQGVYQFMPQWRVGYRYDQLDSGTTSIGLVDSGALTAADFPVLAGYKPKRHTAMVDWSPSEFSRVRLQLARDYSRQSQPDNQVFLQYIVSLGAHGAHTF